MPTLRADEDVDAVYTQVEEVFAEEVFLVSLETNHIRILLENLDQEKGMKEVRN